MVEKHVHKCEVLPLAQDHVPVSIAIGSGTKFWNLFGGWFLAQSHHLHKLLGIGKVGVRVASTEIFLCIGEVHC